MPPKRVMKAMAKKKRKPRRAPAKKKDKASRARPAKRPSMNAKAKVKASPKKKDEDEAQIVSAPSSPSSSSSSSETGTLDHLDPLNQPSDEERIEILKQLPDTFASREYVEEDRLGMIGDCGFWYMVHFDLVRLSQFVVSGCRSF